MKNWLNLKATGHQDGENQVGGLGGTWGRMVTVCLLFGGSLPSIVLDIVNIQINGLFIEKYIFACLEAQTMQNLLNLCR
jgi:hypothetical protein